MNGASVVHAIGAFSARVTDVFACQVWGWDVLREAPKNFGIRGSAPPLVVCSQEGGP